MSGDRLILGGLIDSATLGMYSIAYFLVSAGEELVGKLAYSVAFPSFSEVVRNSPEQLKSVYYKFRLYFDIILLFAFGLMFSSGHLLIDVLYDRRYQGAGRMLEILSFVLFEGRFIVSQQLFIALGKPGFNVPVMISKIIPMYCLMPLLFGTFGMQGELWIVAFSGLFTFPVIFWYKIKLGYFDMRRELLVLPIAAIGYGVGFVVLAIFKNLHPS